MKAAITILDLGYDFAREIAELNKLGLHAEYISMNGTDDVQAIGSALKGYDFILAGPELWSDEAFERVGSQLKMIARLGVGVDRVDITAATRRGIAVCNAPGGNACSVAQHALSLMLDLSMGITRYDRIVRSGKPATRTMSNDLIGKTVGLLGFGRIAAELTKLLSGFDCNIIAYDLYKNEALAESLGVKYVELDELLATSDYVSLHLPLTENSRGMVDLSFFKCMKSSAYFINTARGQIVKEDDLVYSLKNGVIAGAGLDVFEKALNDNALLSLDNVVVTPYVAFSSALGNKRTSDLAIECVRNYLENRKIDHLLNPEYTQYMGRKRV